jgi:hypothetical protein
MLLFKVGKTFRVAGRGYILTPGYHKATASAGGLKIKIGSKIMLLFPDHSSVVTEITGINFRAPFDILIRSADDVPVGTEVWLMQKNTGD